MEKISALMDGELTGQEAHQALLRLDDTAEARESWAAYHLIGDVMRGETAPAFDVTARVADALGREATVLAPRRTRITASPLTFALSAAASVSAIAVVGWMAFSTGNLVNPPAELARAVPAVAPVAETQLVSAPSDGQMNEYLLAHQGVSPSTNLHGVAPYIRTISVAPAAGQ
ncbi:MAG: sigma-E factor negative regulatory protein [Burkholderiales bacterium]